MDRLEKLCVEKGLRMTEPRRVIARVLSTSTDHPDAEAIVLSCTDMRSVETIERLETHVRKPVITSNQAMVFQALQLSGIKQGFQGYGTLLTGELL